MMPKTDKTLGDSDSEMLNLDNELHSLTHYANDVEELVAQLFSTIKGQKLNAMLPPILKEIPLIDVQQLCRHELRGMSSRRILSIINGVEMTDSSSESEDEKEKKKSITEIKNEPTIVDGETAEDSNLTELDVKELEMRAKLIKTMLTKDGDEEEVEFDPEVVIKEEPQSPEEDGSRRSSRKHKKKKRTSRYSRKRHPSSSSYSSYSSSSYSSRSRSPSSKSEYSLSSDSEYARERRKIKEEMIKAGKKKITRKEFEERMRKAKMNRRYRKKKMSDDDSGNEKKGKERKGKSRKPRAPVDDEEEMKEVADETKASITAAAPIEEAEPEDIPHEEKEEGEWDSNEEPSLSDLSSKSVGSDSETEQRKVPPATPKVPNWDPSSANVLPKPIPEDRQSVSFSFGKKVNTTEDTSAYIAVDKLSISEEGSQDASEVAEEDENEETSQDAANEEDDEEEEESRYATEIIGEIEPKADDPNLDPEDNSWSARWLQSEKVQQVVSNSKMLSKLRKNIQAKGKGNIKKGAMGKKSILPITTLTSTAKMPQKKKMVAGSVVDAFGLKVNVPQSLPTPKAPKAPVEQKPKSMSALLDEDDDDEDSEDDALWSKIMKA